MPSTPEAVEAFQAELAFCSRLRKAANAGGVAHFWFGNEPELHALCLDLQKK